MILSVCSAGSGELRSRRRSSTATPVSKLAPAFLGSPALSTRVRSVTATVIRRLSEVTDTRRLSRCRYPRSSARGRRLSRQMTRKAAAARARNCRTPAVMRACRRRRRLRLDPSSLDHAHGCSHVGFYDWQVMKTATASRTNCFLSPIAIHVRLVPWPRIQICRTLGTAAAAAVEKSRR